MPNNNKPVAALKELIALCLEMGHTIRSLDENCEHLEEWTLDGEYILDDRFGRVCEVITRAEDQEGMPS